MNEYNLVPNIRFRKFEKNWETEKLEKLGNTFPSLSGKSKKDFGHGNAKYITYMNVFTNPIALMSGTEAIEIDKKQNSVKYGDVLFTMSSETPKEVGMSSVWEYHLENVYLNSFSFGFRPNSKFDLNFLAFLLRSQGIRSQIVILAQGISRFNISKFKMMRINITFPINHFEQKKIGDFFTKLYKLLDLQQQKVDKLESLKKVLLKKLFPKHDTKIPELRFKGYEEDWVDRKFVNCLAKIIDFRGKTPKKLGLSWSRNGNYRALSALNVKNGFIDKNIDVHFGNYDLYKKWMGKTELKKGDILFTTEAPMGNVAIIKDNEKYILSQRTIAFRVNEKNINSLFLLYRLNTVSVKNKLMSLSTGGTAQGISQKNLSYLFISISNSLDEQKRIGNVLAKVDHLIYLENKKLENLQQFKKCLLQNMFVE